MQVNLCPMFGEHPRSSSVIKVNVGEKNVANVLQRIAVGLKVLFQRCEGGVRAGLDEYRAFSCFNQK